ncbi:hypothetical protein ABZX39_33420 [Streptomyces collinus]|uniref:hypothetical protein n=1 Tax=Streptomyces collinus TaxID=42684 RepID=UPI0033B46D7B
MEFPHNRITAKTTNEDTTAYVSIYVQSDSFSIDEAGLTAAVQQWLLDNAPEVVATRAERREQTFPVTELPPLPA